MRRPDALAGQEKERVLPSLVHEPGAQRVGGRLPLRRDLALQHLKLAGVKVNGVRHGHHAAAVSELPVLRGAELHALVRRDVIHLEASAVQLPTHHGHRHVESTGRAGYMTRANGIGPAGKAK
jgi:hypothetical protein